MTEKYSIAIVTYQHRFEKWFKPLIKQIREFRPDVEIMVAINGELDHIDQTYRKDVLSFISEYDYIYPNVYTSFRSLPKLWNNLMINATNHLILTLNDDITIQSEKFFDGLEEYIKSENFFKINGSWSHTLMDRRVMSKIGWFDERFLCIGEEDGDIEWRIGKLTNGQRVTSLELPDIVNHVDPEDCLIDIKKVNGKYSQFNLDFTYNHKYEVNNETGEQYGINPRKLVCKSPTPPQHVVEPFYWENKHLL